MTDDSVAFVIGTNSKGDRLLLSIWRGPISSTITLDERQARSIAAELIREADSLPREASADDLGIAA